MYKYKAELLRVVDGDTIDAMIDLGFDTWVKKRIRLFGINTSETKTKNQSEKALGEVAKSKVVELLKEKNNKFVLVSLGLEKYGRVLGEILLDEGVTPNISLNNILVEQGYAKKYTP